MQPKSGYKTITPIQICNALSLLENEKLSRKSLQIYFACFSLIAIREAANRSQKKKSRKGMVIPSYRLRELSRTTELPLNVIKKELSKLSSLGLLTFSESKILITKDSIEASGELLENLSGKRSPKRPIPMPRSILRFLSKCKKESLIKTLLAYIIRGLTLSRDGEIKGQGSVKCSWISDVMGISLRSVKGARKELIELRILTPDTGSTQWKLNKTGAYFTINLDWVEKTQKEGRELVIRQNKSDNVTYQTKLCSKSVDKLISDKKILAPPTPQEHINFAPPYKDKKTSSYEEYKNQKTLGEPKIPAGVFSKQGGRKISKPTLSNVLEVDLKDFSRCESLYFQACKQGIIQAGEASAINFLASAVRARSVEGEAPKIFMGLIKKKLWHHITQADEDRALSALRRYRIDNPERFRVMGKESLMIAA